ncbi:AAA family ATPase [Clavibacter zhangzhiyongii]|uniref:AAA family ATPase n=1 Tax=Clavibacter zhangzhiyongii TaxID=2768071 RepID=UPI0039DF897B
MIASDSFNNQRVAMSLTPHMSPQALKALENNLSHLARFMFDRYSEDKEARGAAELGVSVSRDRCFLEGVVTSRASGRGTNSIGVDAFDSFTDTWAKLIRDIIHVPGLRGNPEREYPRAAAGNSFPGTFDQYVASVILQWGERNDPRLDLLSHQMHLLGLTWKIFAKRKNDATVEVLVGRMAHPQQGGAQDMVSIADVGFGVSQTLPVIVGLLAARPGQIVYIEQPEIHLHPRAQVELGAILVQAASRGVKVVAETHSSLLIRSIQTQLAARHIKPKDVSLNWFGRDALTGNTTVEAADLDEQGRFGSWPLDFDDVAEAADMAYIRAIRTGAST